ncbi:cell division protein FtsL [Sapientia aquatica]|jgi:cell division protein FtsL|uniref:Cell division protein FtsL n=1 Tax=Sapientia aquatica TaxID=1549640 RepID=A0A4R5W377_9BURK|nr:cell division protein FtsL [Sapientia aquatica]TDK67032.1 cell division protein FtsL [Sapientia aquatica]
MNGRLNVLLLIALLACALILVKTQYQARHLFIELERSQTEARQLEVEWSQLQLDQSNLGKHERIQANAIKDLNMVPVTNDRTQYITLNTK